MAKIKSSYFCQNCGAQSLKWVGKCPSCGEWNTLVEEVISSDEKEDWKSKEKKTNRVSKPQLISEITLSDEHRIPVPDKE